MKALTVIIAAAVGMLTGFDGYAEQPVNAIEQAEYADAGVYAVTSAIAETGESLPPGWWLSPARMSKVGDALNTCGAVPQASASSAVALPVVISSLVGLVVGALVLPYVAKKTAPAPKPVATQQTP